MNGIEPRDGIDRYVRLITQLGLPTVCAGVLLWWVLMRLSGVLDAMVVEMRQQTQTLGAIQQHIVERDGR